MKVWDKDGNVTERMVDVSKVDTTGSDYIDMFAYSSHLLASWKCPGAQSATDYLSTEDIVDASVDELVAFISSKSRGRIADPEQTTYLLPRLSLRPFDCPYLFACIFGIKIVEQVTERGKIVVAFCAVYTVIDCDISNVALYEKNFRIVADFQIIAPQS